MNLLQERGWKLGTPFGGHCRVKHSLSSGATSDQWLPSQRQTPVPLDCMVPISYSCEGNKGVDITGLLGDLKENWGSGGGSRVQGGELKLFFMKLHIIFALKYNKQQLLLLLDKINLA